jgi:uncharacterized membrane protein YkoI
MQIKIRSILMSSLVIGAVAVGVPLAASAAKTHTTHATLSHAAKAANGNETPLTGTTLASASAAAVAAVPGATVTSATTEADATGAYEVILTKTDGTSAKVIEDAGFTVLSTTATTCH